MLKSVVLECIISSFIIVCYYGNTVADSQEFQDVANRKVESNKMSTTPDKSSIQKLYSLFNQSMLIQTISGNPNIPENKLPSNSLNGSTSQLGEVLFTSRPFIMSDEKERTDNDLLIEYKPSFNERPIQKNGLLNHVLPPGIIWPPKSSTTKPNLVEDRFKETTPKPLLSEPTTRKSSLEYHPQRPTFVGQLSSGQLGQLIPPGKPLPANPPIAKPVVLEDRFKETTPKPSPAESTPSKSPLEYDPQRPTFAGQLSSGQLGQLIPPGKPLPANPPIAKPVVLEDRFKETTPKPSQAQSTPSKSPLEYDPQRPTFAGQLSSGQLGQLIPPGKPLPANPPIAKPVVLEDRFKETTPKPSQAESTPSQSPLEYDPQRPTFAGQLSSGQLGQLIAPGKPWPANPPIATPVVLEDRFKETTPKPVQAESTPSKSPLEYDPQRPTFAGQLSSGQLGQLIPPGKPWPANPPIAKPVVLEDRFKETTPKPLPAESTPSQSPLEYDPQRPTFAGQLSSGQLGQLIPPGKPWPANPPIAKPVILEDRFKETTPKPLPAQSTPSQSPLEYDPQRPTFAGQSSSGQLGQLIPPGKPLPANPPIAKPVVLEDRFKETTPKPLPAESTPSQSPLEYDPQRPTFAGQLSSGQLGQLIPPGKPWPANPPIAKPVVLEDRFKETTPKPLPAESTPSQSPLDYDPQRPTFAGQLSSGQLSQLIPPGNPWPANPPIAKPVVLEDRFKETTPKPSQAESTPSKSPLEYEPQRPTFAGDLSSGQLGQLIAAGEPWPANPQTVKPVILENSFHETTRKLLQSEPISSKSPK